MQTATLLALALVVRSLPSTDGAVEFAPRPGQSVVAAYSVDIEPVWHHAVPSTVVDRVESARSGRVTGLGPSTHLVLAISDESASFDASGPMPCEPEVFPYSPELVRAYENGSGRRYVRDMMSVAVPFLGSKAARAIAMAELYEALFGLEGGQAAALRSVGPGTAGSVLVVTGRARIMCRLERCFGDDGSAYAQRLAEKGYRVDLVDGAALARLSVGDDGFVRRDGCRYGTMVLRHLSRRDAEACRRLFGNRPLKTKVYLTNSPVVYGAELTAFDPELD